MIVVAWLLAWNLAQWWRDSNSHADSVRGLKAWTKRSYEAAASAFGHANATNPSAVNAFNLGTAEIAAGRREEGAATLQKAMADPALRADAFYNRGNSALSAGAWDYAIRDYAEALRLRPDDAHAKRNLEIAFARRAMQQAGGGKRQSQSGGPKQSQNQQQQGAPSTGPERPQSSAEALLRSVQQQEQEEQQRMRRAGRERLHVGW